MMQIGIWNYTPHRMLNLILTAVCAIFVLQLMGGLRKRQGHQNVLADRDTIRVTIRNAMNGITKVGE
tara:strand:+ start:6443 stop:6643 length:201 start_codon:yes stop_codon:yes gene_type:complete